MSRRCLICSDINPCRHHSDAEQAGELRRNDAAIARIRAEAAERTPPPMTAEQGDVEKVARMVDGEAFNLIEHYKGLSRAGDDKLTAAEKEARTFRAYPSLKERRDVAFQKAREIIVALKASPPEALSQERGA